MHCNQYVKTSVTCVTGMPKKLPLSTFQAILTYAVHTCQCFCTRCGRWRGSDVSHNTQTTIDFKFTSAHPASRFSKSSIGWNSSVLQFGFSRQHGYIKIWQSRYFLVLCLTLFKNLSRLGPIADLLARKAYVAGYDRRLRHPAWVS